MSYQLWSWLLMTVGVTGLWLAGERSWTGWAVGLGAQVLWLAYSLVTEQWGFLASCFVYGAVYVRNLRAWLRPIPAVAVNVAAPDPTTVVAPVRVDRPLVVRESPLREHSGPVRCLTSYCTRPATHWHDGAPRCEPCAWNAIEEEGRNGFSPVPGSSAEFAAYYLDRDMNPALRVGGEVR